MPDPTTTTSTEKLRYDTGSGSCLRDTVTSINGIPEPAVSTTEENRECCSTGVAGDPQNLSSEGVDNLLMACLVEPSYNWDDVMK